LGGVKGEYGKLTTVANYIKLLLKRGLACIYMQQNCNLFCPHTSKALLLCSAVKMTKKNPPPQEIMQIISISVLNALVKHLIIRFFTLKTVQRESATGE